MMKKSNGSKSKRQHKMEFITAQELSQRKDEYLILDIRDNESFTQKHIEGSLNIDVYDDIHNGDYRIVEKKLSSLPKTKTIITVCNAGITAQPASSILGSMGYTTKVLEDGMLGWNF